MGYDFIAGRKFSVEQYWGLSVVDWRAFLGVLETVSGGRVLDVGCYRCKMKEYTDRYGIEYYGVDVVDYGCSIPRFYSCTAGKPGVYICDYMDFWSNVRFSAVFLIESLEHLYDYVIALEKTRALLEDAGILYIQSPHPFMLESVMDETHLHVLNPVTLSRILEKIGYRVYYESTAGTSFTLAAIKK